MAKEDRRNVVSTRVTDQELDELQSVVEEEGFTNIAALEYKIIFDFLKSKRLERKGQRIVLEHIGLPPSDER